MSRGEAGASTRKKEQEGQEAKRRRRGREGGQDRAGQREEKSPASRVGLSPTKTSFE